MQGAWARSVQKNGGSGCGSFAEMAPNKVESEGSSSQGREWLARFKRMMARGSRCLRK